MTPDRIAEIASRIKLCSLNTGAWRATRLHRDESAKVNAAHNTAYAAKVHVRLTNSPALHALNKLHAEAYDAHRRLTLPSIQDGLRLIPAGRELEHSQKMQDFAARHDAIKVQFLAEYEEEKRTAPVRLNGLFNAAHWPAGWVVAEKFTFKTRYLSCPASNGWADWITESAQAAEDELRERLTEALRHLVDRCAGDGKLYASVFENLREVCALVPDLNFQEAPELTAAANVAQSLGALDADTLRDNKTARKQASDKARSILAAMGAQ